MKRVHVICEGQTEETFVNEILRPHLVAFSVLPIAALVGKPGHKGGTVNTARMTYDIKLRLTQDTHAWCTTFFDYYGLDSNFPGKGQAGTQMAFNQKAQSIESALRDHILEQTDDNAIRRFIPYVQMYEFEGLLFSDPAKFAAGLYARELEGDLAAIRSGFSSPEEINNSPATAPSKRVLALLPGYEKPLYGSLAAIEIGLDAIRGECGRFHVWIQRLEELGSA